MKIYSRKKKLIEEHYKNFKDKPFFPNDFLITYKYIYEY